jgi:hypothetical protein
VNPSQDPRRRGWQQQAIGIIIIALLIFAIAFARYHRALLK